MDTSKFLPGDIGLSTDNSWMAKAIKWFESIWTREANFSHAFCYIGTGHCVEALSKISVNPMSKYDNKTISMYRIPIKEEERYALAIGLIRRVNLAYGWLKYPFFVLDAGATWVKNLFGNKKPCFFFTKHFGISNIPVCSQLVVWGIHKFTSYRFKDVCGDVIDWRVATPDYLEDLLKIPHNNAVLIYEQKEDKNAKINSKRLIAGFSFGV